jgi:HEAT repeat protein
MAEVVHILGDRGEYDAKTRAYMAVALSRFDNPEAVTALRAALKDETEGDVKLHIAWALGQRKVFEAAEDLLPLLASEDAELVKTAAYVLGALGNPSAVPALAPLLAYEERDVRWNAAVALARLGSDAGFEVLTKMLDRGILAGQEGMTDERIEEVMVNAAKGMALTGRRDAIELLETVAGRDKSLKVRQAAIEALSYIKKEAA